ncbi:MAG TPA: UDP-3-O-(3-hydroxymyristoyl)glucosamine N-acyltransferase [Terriglobia bacterium]|nr:UDP-3-O-(3-hydroxymyristoyl)glucosamine N-acyltransferase [Terriglobia bacterium]
MMAETIAQLLAGKLEGDGSREIRGVARIEDATGDQLSFVEGGRQIQLAEASRAGCILVPQGSSLPGRTTIAVPSPKLAFIRAAHFLHPVAAPSPGIHPSAIVSEEAFLDGEVRVGPNVVIERGARVGQGTSLAAGAFVGEGSEVGSGCMLYPRVTLYPGVRLGNRVVLQAGVVIGGDGFGYVLSEGRHHKFPQIGRVVIEDDVEIGCNTTVDRGSLGTTTIGEGTKIDNLVQIAHNVRIGKHCVIVAQTGISGSTTIGDYVVIAGQVGIGEHALIESRAVIGGQAGILPGKVVREGMVVWGTPARPLADFKRLHAYVAQLPNWTG